LVALRIVDPDAEVARAARRREDLHLVQPVVRQRTLRECTGGRCQISPDEAGEVVDRRIEADAEVDDASLREGPEGPTSGDREIEQSQEALSAVRRARCNTPSRRRSSSGVAGTMGRRCSLERVIPRRFIMYLMGMGLVSKNTA